MERKFKVEDKVRYVRYDHWAVEAGLSLGSVYTVRMVYGNLLELYEGKCGGNLSLTAKAFELAVSEKKIIKEYGIVKFMKETTKVL